MSHAPTAPVASRAGDAERTPWRSRDTATPPSWSTMARAWVALTGVVLVTAAVTAVVAPDWLAGPTRELPDDPLFMAELFTRNLLLAVVIPLLGGWLAAGQRLEGRRIRAAIFVVLPGVIIARSLLTIGAVGGADLPWLADAARWWLLELVAVAAAGTTGLWLARHPHLRRTQGPAAIRRAAMIAASALACGALIEVLTA